MEIRLPVGLESMFQEAVEVFDSYHDPDDPGAIKDTCAGFLTNLTGKVRDSMEVPYYLALALMGMVKFTDEKDCLLCLEDGELPCWEDIKIKKPAVAFITEIRQVNDDLAKQVVMVAFCLNCGHTVLRADGSDFNHCLPSQNEDNGFDDTYPEGEDENE